MKKEEIMGKCLVPNEKLISWREIDNEIVLLHKKEKAFYELNKTADFIWKRAIEKEKVKEIIEAMQKVYRKVNRDILKKDALDFIDDLFKKKIFIIEK